jgi:Tfp pilus assembly protein PilO
MELFLSLATVSLFGIFAIRPTLITIAELLKEIESKKQIISTMNEKIQNLNQAQSLYDEEKQNIDLLKSAIPKEAEPDRYVRQIEGVVSQNPVTILSLSLGKTNLLGGETSAATSADNAPLPEGASGLSFTINASSDFPVLALFVSSLESLRRPYQLDSLVINTSETETTKELILVITARAPYLKGEE